MPALCAQYVALSQAESGSSRAGFLVTKGPVLFTWAAGSQEWGCRWGGADADLPGAPGGPVAAGRGWLPSPSPPLAPGCHGVPRSAGQLGPLVRLGGEEPKPCPLA